MSGFSIPNHTQTPNALFDELMKDMTEAELKVTLAVIRKTLGYHKQQDPISWSQIMQMTGLSKATTQRGIDLALERGLIEIAGHGKRGVNIFRLVLNLDQSEINTSSSINFRPVLVSNSDTQKKGLKEKKRNKSTPTIHPFIQAWATIRGIDAINIGAPIFSPKDATCARRMAKWPTPPTESEIKDAIQSSKSRDYAFQWLEGDIPKIRLARGANPTPVPAPPPPAEPVIELTPEQAAARVAEFNRLMAEMTEAIVEKAVA